MASLKAAGIRAEIDERDNYTAGWKYNYWEQRGVPVRMEIGPKDLANKQVSLARRDDCTKTGKTFVAWEDVVSSVSTLVCIAAHLRSAS